MKKINKLILLAFISFLCFFITSCVKERDGATDFSNTKPLAEILLSGKAFFSKASLLVNPSLTDPIEREIAINIASVYPLKEDVTITLDVADEERVAYNADITNPDEKFNAMTSNQYSFPQRTVTIKAGERFAKLKLQFFQDKFDPTKSWMLPVKIKSTSNNLLISANNGVVYFNVIGNPIAGTYLWDFTRWNNQSGSGTPSSLSFKGENTLFIPVSPTAIEVESGYVAIRYVLSFTNTAGTLSNFKVKMNDKDVEDLKASNITITDGPRILVADPVTGHYKLQFVAFNGAAFRYLIDEYYK